MPSRLEYLTGAARAYLGRGHPVALAYLKACETGTGSDIVAAKVALARLPPETQKAIQRIAHEVEPPKPEGPRPRPRNI